MNISFIANLRALARTHKALACLAIALLVAALGCGAYFAVQHYLYRQSPRFVYDNIKNALNPPDPSALAQYVDFNAISSDLARAISKNFPFYLEGKDQERNIRHAIQTALLKNFTEKEDKKQQIPTEEKEEDLLRKDIQILPRDFASAIFDSMQLRENTPNSAIITAKVEHPDLKKSFTLVFNLDKVRKDWRVTHLSNAAEVTGQMRNLLMQRYARLRQVFQEKNNATRKMMDQLIPIQSCSAHAGTLSDGRTMLMVVHVIARNLGNLQVNNFNVDTAISGKSGQVLMRRFLNAAKPVAPGEDFDHRWNFEMEASNPEARKLLSGQPLQCSAKWQTLSLNNGRVLHIVEEPNPDRQCSIKGHDHPEGFCKLSVFSRQ